MKAKLGGIKSRGRKLLGMLLEDSRNSITVIEAAKILHIDRYRAASLLALWARNGWLCRVRRGLYIPVALQSASPEVIPDEPWLIAHKLFSPCYIGGWTAAHHFGFTEQLFNSIYVLTTKKIHNREQILKGVAFKIKTILPSKFFGTQFVWIGKIKVAVSDPTKIVIDGLNDPSTLGGIRMMADILSAYIRSNEFDLKKLFAYANAMENSAIYKRLGFLMELLQIKDANVIIHTCKANLKSGYSQLDPTIIGDRLETRWNLWTPRSFSIEE